MNPYHLDGQPLEMKVDWICYFLKTTLFLRRPENSTHWNGLATSELLQDGDLFNAVVGRLISEGYLVQEEREFKGVSYERCGSRIRVSRPVTMGSPRLPDRPLPV
jgi:hypothetical protein